MLASALTALKEHRVVYLQDVAYYMRNRVEVSVDYHLRECHWLNIPLVYPRTRTIHGGNDCSRCGFQSRTFQAIVRYFGEHSQRLPKYR